MATFSVLMHILLVFTLIFIESDALPTRDGEEEAGNNEITRKSPSVIEGTHVAGVNPDPSEVHVCTKPIAFDNCETYPCGRRCDHRRPVALASTECRKNGVSRRKTQCCRCRPSGINIVNVGSDIKDCGTGDVAGCIPGNN